MQANSVKEGEEMHRWFSLLQMAILVFVFADPAGSWADSVRLKTGKELDGRIVSETEKAVEIEVGGMTLKIARDKIDSIDRTAQTEDSSTTGPAALKRLESLELEGKWPDLYEAAEALLRDDPKNAVAAEKKKAARAKILESMGHKKVTQLVRERKFDGAIAYLTEQFRRSGLQDRGAGAVGRRALAEVHLSKAEARMRTSLDGHAPLAEARKARELDPTAPRLDYIEGMAQIKLHHFKQAATLLERATRLQPEDFGIRLPLLQCYDQLGEYLKIVLTFEAAPVEARASADRWPEVRQVLSKAYMRVALDAADKRTTPQATAAYDKYLSFTKRTPNDLREAIQFFERMGDHKRAAAIRDERFRGTEIETPEDDKPPK